MESCRNFSQRNTNWRRKKTQIIEIAVSTGSRITMERITKYSELKKRSLETRDFLTDLSNEIPSNLPDGGRNIHSEREEAKRVSSELSGCANYLVFHNYWTIEEIRLSKVITCKKHLLCPFCAARRATKQVQKNGDRIREVLENNKNLIPVMITLTVKNGDDLTERFEHIKKSFQKLQQKRKDAIRGKTETEFTKVTGSMFSYEVTNKGNGWHPHIHMVALLDNYIDQKKLANEWEAITKDSRIIDIRKITSKSDEAGQPLDITDALLEVFKYALKFSDLDLELTWEAYRTLKGKRLLGSFGNLYGSNLEPENLLDELLDDLPYLEMFYTYSKYLGSYELKTTIQKEAQSNMPSLIKEVSQGKKKQALLIRPVNPPSKEVLMPRVQIRGIKPKLSRLDQYLEDNKEIKND